MATFFEDIKTYVGFTAEDSAVLRELHPIAEPFLSVIIGEFYDEIIRHPDTFAALTGGLPQIERLKGTLTEWASSGLLGPHDEAYHQRRERIGHVHVRIGLPQQYMMGGMNIIRRGFHRIVDDLLGDDPDRRRRTDEALDRLFDLELAIMLESYHAASEARLRRSERLAVVGQVAGSIAHDLRNPLAVVQASLYLVRKTAAEDSQATEYIDRASEQVQQCSEIIDTLLALGRKRRLQRTDIDMHEVIGRALSVVPIPDGFSVEEILEDGLELHADAGLVGQVIANLVGNAIESYEGHPGRVSIHARRDAGNIVIEVVDDGAGFDPAMMSLAFEPLVTTKETGTGLGLALVKSVIEMHDGSVEAENREQGGATVRVRFPVVPKCA